MNLYDVLDNELKRMHGLLDTIMRSSGENKDANVVEVYKRIAGMQDKLMVALEKHDALIQEKVAQLALTGDSNEET